MSSIETFTKEQLDIALLKNTNEAMLRTLSEVKRQALWSNVLLFGIYALGLSIFVLKIVNIFS